MTKLTKKILLLGILLGVFSIGSRAQNMGFSGNMNQGIIQIAEQGQLADTLNLWGDVRNSGKYLVPRGTNLTDLISYARGPSGVTGGQTWTKVNLDIYISHYNESNNEYSNKKFNLKLNEPLPAAMKNYPLYNGDVITVKAKHKPTFRDYFTIIAPVLSLGFTAFLAIDRLNRR